MSKFKIIGKELPEGFDANRVSFDNKKKPNDPSMENEGLSKDELIAKFNRTTSKGKELRKLLAKSISTHRRKYGYDTNDAIENYHYFICPISGERVVGFDQCHFNRLGISRLRFLELFPDFNECFVYPPINTIKQRLKVKPKKVKTKSYGTKVINGHTFDLDHYYEHYKKVVGKNIKARKKELGNEWILNYSYFECPLTGEPITLMASTGHLKSLQLTKEEFKTIFPDINVDICQTPKARKFSYQEYLNNEHIHGRMYNGKYLSEYSLKKDMDDNDIKNFAERFMHITNKDEYLKVIEQDHYFKEYKCVRKSTESRLPDEILNGVEGIDYFICPIMNIKYVKHNDKGFKNFGITEERIREWFPNIQLSTAPSHSDNISAGLGAIDPETGLSRHDVSVIKSSETRRKTNADGLSINDQIGIKTRQSHLNNIDVYGRNGYQQLADSRNVRKGETLPKTRQERYERVIELMTNRCRDIYNYVNDDGITWGEFGSSSVAHTYQIDHKYSRNAGYYDMISPVCIGNLKNTDMIDTSYNITKKNRCSITKADLANLNKMTIDEMEDEFSRIMDVIDDHIANDIPHNSMNVLIEAGHDIAIKMKPYNEIVRYIKYDSPIDTSTILNIISSL